MKAIITIASSCLCLCVLCVYVSFINEMTSFLNSHVLYTSLSILHQLGCQSRAIYSCRGELRFVVSLYII